MLRGGFGRWVYLAWAVVLVLVLDQEAWRGGGCLRLLYMLAVQAHTVAGLDGRGIAGELVDLAAAVGLQLHAVGAVGDAAIQRVVCVVHLDGDDGADDRAHADCHADHLSLRGADGEVVAA